MDAQLPSFRSGCHSSPPLCVRSGPPTSRWRASVFDVFLVQTQLPCRASLSCLHSLSASQHLSRCTASAAEHSIAVSFADMTAEYFWGKSPLPRCAPVSGAHVCGDSQFFRHILPIPAHGIMREQRYAGPRPAHGIIRGRLSRTPSAKQLRRPLEHGRSREQHQDLTCDLFPLPCIWASWRVPVLSEPVTRCADAVSWA